MRQHAWFATVALCGTLTLAGTARAELPPQPKDEAPLVVEGVVREVFRDTKDANVNYLVQLEVTGSSAGKGARHPGRLVLPAPGESVYVHLFQRRTDAPAMPSGSGHRAIPAEQAKIKAYLYPRDEGGWQGAYPDWFDAAPGAAAVPPSRPTTPPAADARPPRILGVKVEGVSKGKLQGVKVDKLMPDGPAAKAGIEVGDVILEVDGQPTTSTAQLNEHVRQGGATLTLTVVDKNTGAKVPVKVAMGAANPDMSDRPKPSTDAAPPATSGTKASLGVVVDFDIVERTSGLKILDVQPGSLAQKAGLQKGQVIIDANNIIALNGEQLDEVVKASGPVLKLKVFDPTSGRKSTVEVKLTGP